MSNHDTESDMLWDILMSLKCTDAPRYGAVKRAHKEVSALMNKQYGLALDNVLFDGTTVTHKGKEFKVTQLIGEISNGGQ